MATFYLLPPRCALADHLLAALGPCLPGLDGTAAARQRMTDALLDAVEVPDGVFFVFRDELPPSAAAEPALVDGYGAEAGDEVVEVRLGQAARRWRIGHDPRLAA